MCMCSCPYDVTTAIADQAQAYKSSIDIEFSLPPKGTGQTTEAQDHSCGLLILLHQFQTHIRCFASFIW